MPTHITSQAGPIRGLAGLQQLSQAEALHVLGKIEAQVQGHSGVLKLMHTSKDRDMSFERKSWWQAFARRSSKAEQTGQALVSLYRQAGMSPAAIGQLQDYLGSHQNKVGGRSLTQLLQLHRQNQTSETLIRKALPAETGFISAFVRRNLLGSTQERQVAQDPFLGLSFIKSQLNGKSDFNPNYRIQTPNGTLAGFSRSANPGGAAFDLRQPIVIFLSGSHMPCEAAALPAACEMGSDSPVPRNFLAVDYRGFGQSAGARPTPRSITEDAIQIYDHVRSLGFPPEKIIVRGYSLGAAAAGRIQAVAEMRGERLGAVVYDRPMAAAPVVAKAQSGWAAQAVASLSVGRFGAEQYLDVLAQKRGSPSSPVTVIVDTSDDLGPSSAAMANRHGLPMLRSMSGHEDHDAANRAFAQALHPLGL